MSANKGFTNKTRLTSLPFSKPLRKGREAGKVAALATVITWIADVGFHYSIPGYVALAIGSILSGLRFYYSLEEKQFVFFLDDVREP